MKAENKKSDIESMEKLTALNNKIKKEIAKIIVGQNEIIDQILVSLFAKGHCLLIGVPGLAKTLIIKTLS